MDQQFDTTGGIVTGYILIFCGFIMAPLGIGGLCSYPDIAWVFGAILTICSAILLTSGIAGIISTKKKETEAKKFLVKMIAESSKLHERTENAETKTVSDEKPVVKTEDVETSLMTDGKPVTAIENTETKVTTDDKPVILADWTYSQEEWAAFFKKDVSTLNSSIILVGILIIVFGTLMIYYQDGDWLLGFICSTVIATIISVIRFTMHRSTIQKSAGVSNHVIIGLDTIIINGKMIVLRHENRWLSKLELLEDQQPAVIEFTYCWNTSNGVSNNEIRVPVPAGKINEAKGIISRIKDFHMIR